MDSNLIINGNVKDAIDRTYKQCNIIFNHETIFCLAFKLNGYLYLIKFNDMQSFELSLLKRFDASMCSNEYIVDNQLCLVKVMIADDIMLATIENSFDNIDINELILNRNINDIGIDIYHDYLGLEIEEDILSLLPQLRINE